MPTRHHQFTQFKTPTIIMTSQRLSHLQQRILTWLETDWQRTKGSTTASHYELVKHLPDIDKSNLSHSLVNLEKKGYVTIIRTEGSLAESIILHKVVIKW